MIRHSTHAFCDVCDDEIGYEVSNSGWKKQLEKLGWEMKNGRDICPSCVETEIFTG